MTEIVHDRMESGEESQAAVQESRFTDFEPEILAFCCEH
jgi:hypothetical protein